MNRRAFTLVELLVVIAIIGVLSSVVLASLNTSRARARDAERKAELRQLRMAVEQYYAAYGTYQITGGGYNGGGSGYMAQEGAANYTTAISRVLYNLGYIGAPIIEDPQQRPGYMYYYCNNGQQFSISATLENPTANDIAYIQTTCNGSGGNGTYPVYGKNYATGN